MSWRVYMEIDTGGPEPYKIDDDYLNYTYNVSPMYYDAIGEHGLRGLHGMTGEEAADALLSAELRLSDDPEKYKAMNPPNGWGDYEGAKNFLHRIRMMCEAHPKALLVIS